MEGGSGHRGRQMCEVKKVCTCIVSFYFQIRINHKARFVLMIGFAEGARD